MRRIPRLLLAAVVAVSTFGTVQSAAAGPAAAAPVVSLILDTDIEEDVDDAGTVGMLHALADRGEVRLLGMMVDTSGQHGASALDAINTWYNRPDVPIGTLKPTTDGTRSLYNRQLSAEFPHDLASGYDAPDAVALYRRLLAAEPDGSVTIASVGLLTNLRNLLSSGPDGASGLNGRDLVARKVRELVVMGGTFPEGREFNFFMDVPSTVAVTRDWPGRMVFSGFEIGDTVFTGARLVNEAPHTSPVRRAYQLYVGDGNNRNSWDQTAAYVAVRGTAGLFGLAGEVGSVTVDAGDGSNRWVSSPDRDQAYLTTTASDGDIARTIEDLMVARPGMRNTTGQFVLGVNFDGPAVTVEGSGWRSYDDALAQGLSVRPGANRARNGINPRPAVSGGEYEMLHGELWQSGDMGLDQSLSGGTYDVYFWVAEDYRDHYHGFDVQLEGAPVATVRTGRVDEWARYGPYRVTVGDGTLDVDLRRLYGDTLIQGLAVYRA
jgi:hypothetical protein